MNRHPTSRQRGITLVEQLIVLAIAVVVLGAALPGFEQMRSRRHLEGTTAQLETELQYARSLAVARNEAVRFSFETRGAASCYVIHSGGPNECSCIGGQAPVCTHGAEAVRSAWFGPDSPVSVRSNSRSVGFSAHNRTVTPTATMEITNRRSEALRLVINIMGRVRSCTPTAAVQGYARC